MPLHTLTDEASLDRVVSHHDTVVIDFWAPWCTPCKAFQPILEKAAEAYADMAFCRVNTQAHEALARAFEIKSIPTLVVIRDRIMIAAQPGYLPAEKLEALLGRVRQVDMDAVRREMAQEQAGSAADS